MKRPPASHRTRRTPWTPSILVLLALAGCANTLDRVTTESRLVPDREPTTTTRSHRILFDRSHFQHFEPTVRVLLVERRGYRQVRVERQYELATPYSGLTKVGELILCPVNLVAAPIAMIFDLGRHLSQTGAYCNPFVNEEDEERTVKRFLRDEEVGVSPELHWTERAKPAAGAALFVAFPGGTPLRLETNAEGEAAFHLLDLLGAPIVERPKSVEAWVALPGRAISEVASIRLGAELARRVFAAQEFLPVAGVAPGERDRRGLRRLGFSRYAARLEQREAAPRFRAARELPDVAAPPADPAPYGRYYALVIGNARYDQMPDLDTVSRDAEEVVSLLRHAYGFETRLLTDASRADIVLALAELRRTLEPTDNLLVYYAGHGWLDDETEEGYWLPVDAARDDPSNWLSSGTITTQLRGIRSRSVLVVADSCYAGLLTRGVRLLESSPRGAADRAMRRARVVLTSGGLEPVADGRGGGRHSVFARAFLNALRDNRSVLGSEALFHAIERPVLVNANQTPQFGDIRLAGHDGGEFFFVRSPRIERTRRPELGFAEHSRAESAADHSKFQARSRATPAGDALARP